ncbi:MAG: hypothetical protein HY779_03640, partial [Rubrobacteridae bacterium]|nr:hypothetical protein [Rubrobacteridae bacterium]
KEPATSKPPENPQQYGPGGPEAAAKMPVGGSFPATVNRNLSDTDRNLPSALIVGTVGAMIAILAAGAWFVMQRKKQSDTTA